jgi:hypothetical protein
MTDEAQLVLEALLQLADIATHHIDDGVSALTNMVEGLNDDFLMILMTILNGTVRTMSIMRMLMPSMPL